MRGIRNIARVEKLFFAEHNHLQQEIRDVYAGLHGGRTVKRPFLTALEEFGDNAALRGLIEMPKTSLLEQGQWLKQRTFALIQFARPEDLADGKVLEGLVFHADGRGVNSGDLRSIWQWKYDHKSNTESKPAIQIVLDNIDGLDHSESFSSWLTRQRELYDALSRHASEFPFPPELIQYLTPDVVFSILQPELFSAFDGPTFAQTAPSAYQAYNLAFLPSLNDSLMSSGFTQLTPPLAADCVAAYGKSTRALAQKDSAFKDIFIPTVIQNHGHNGIASPDLARMMVLDAKSAHYWAYIGVLRNADTAFTILIEHPPFRDLWDRSSEEDRLKFTAALGGEGNNGGPGRAQRSARLVLQSVGTRTLLEHAEHLGDIFKVLHPTAWRGAAQSLEAETALIAESKK